MVIGKALPLAVGAFGIVAISFLATSYVLDNFMPRSGALSDVTASLRSIKATNILWPSDDFTNPRWMQYQIETVDPNAGAAPNGENSATRLVESSDESRHYIHAGVDVATPGAVHTFSFYFKPQNRLARLEMGDTKPGKKYGAVLCDPTHGGGGSVSKVADIIEGATEDVGNGWFRCWAAMPFSLASTVLVIELRAQDGKFPYRGDGHSGMLIWGAQFERSNRPSPYVRTSTGPLIAAN